MYFSRLVFFVLFLIFSAQSVVCETFAESPKNQTGWPQSTDGPITFSSAVGDIDGDGDLEVVVYGGKLFAWHHDGALVEGWPVEVEPASCAPALGDVDNDNTLEIAFHSSEGTLYLFDGDGTAIPGWPKTAPKVKWLFRGPTFGDIDLDGDVEIIFPRQKIMIFHHDGTPVDGWPSGTVSDDYHEECPAIGDLNLDGEIEIVTTNLNGQLSVFSKDGKYLPGWPKSGVCYQGSPSLGDIDGDGDIEIVANAYDKTYVLHHDGTIAEGWPQEVEGVMWSAPSLGDVDGDGKLEIISNTAILKTDKGNLYVWNHDGTLVSGWPKEIAYTTVLSPIIGDVDGDKDMEIIVIGTWKEKLMAFHHDGTEVHGWPIIVESVSHNITPTLCDIDRDGDIEVIAAPGDTLNIYDLPGTYDPAYLDWPTFAHDFQRTGFYKKPERLPEPEITPAGTEITNGGDIETQGEADMPGDVLLTYDGHTATTNEVTTIVDQVFGLAELPTPDDQSAICGTAVYYPYHVQNTGNGEDTISLVVETTTNWQVAIIEDTNEDGVHQENEVTEITEVTLLPEDVAYFFLRVAIPDSIEEKTTCEAKLVVKCSGSDDWGDPDVREDTTITTGLQPRIVATKAVDLETARPGDVLTYTITFENAGNADASDVTIEDIIPAWTEFVEASSGGEYDPVTRKVRWDVGKVVVGAKGEVWFKVRIR